MASSRASKPAARRRRQAQSARARGHKAAPQRPKPKPKAPAKPKAKTQGRKAPVKPKARPKVKNKSARPKKAAARSEARVSRTLTVAVVVATLVLGIAAAYFFWFRDSSFVLVEKVTVEGMEGPEAEAVTAALTRAGSKMTTLHVDEDELATSVSRYATVVSVDATTDFPHGLTVEVESRPPVVSVTDGGPPVPAAADGTLLKGVENTSGVPTVNVGEMPANGKLAGEPLEVVQVAGAAPEPLRPLIDGISRGDGDAIEVELEGGIPVIFGDAGEVEEKWAAVAAILANPQVKTLTHLDVRVPERPAIGGAAPPEKEK